MPGHPELHRPAGRGLAPPSAAQEKRPGAWHSGPWRAGKAGVPCKSGPFPLERAAPVERETCGPMDGGETAGVRARRLRVRPPVAQRRGALPSAAQEKRPGAWRSGPWRAGNAGVPCKSGPFPPWKGRPSPKKKPAARWAAAKRRASGRDAFRRARKKARGIALRALACRKRRRTLQKRAVSPWKGRPSSKEKPAARWTLGVRARRLPPHKKKRPGAWHSGPWRAGNAGAPCKSGPFPPWKGRPSPKKKPAARWAAAKRRASGRDAFGFGLPWFGDWAHRLPPRKKNGPGLGAPGLGVPETPARLAKVGLSHWKGRPSPKKKPAARWAAAKRRAFGYGAASGRTLPLAAPGP